jgi:hypothetical protein
MALREAGERRRPCTSFAADHDEPCANCGSYRHITARCTHRDDAVEGTSIPGHNGRYEGPLEVRHLPPGFSFTDQPFAVVRPTPTAGQVWRSPNGMLFAVHAIEDGVVIIRRTSIRLSGGTPGFPRVPLARFTARYRFVRGR